MLEGLGGTANLSCTCHFNSGVGGGIKHEKDKFDGEKRRAEEDSRRHAGRLEPTQIRGQRRLRAAFHVRLKVQHCSAASRCAISRGGRGH